MSHEASGAQASGAAAADNNSTHSTRDDVSQDGVINKQELKRTTSKREKVRNHCAKYWMYHLIATIILLAILLPLLFKVIIPAIVQDIVKKQKIPIYGGALMVLNPNTINVSLQTSLDTPLPAKIAELPLDLYNKDTPDYSPFATLTLPAMDVNHKTNATITNQTITVKNQTELIKWFDHVFEQNKVDLSIHARPHVSLGELKSNPTLDKTIQLDGLDRLRSFGITDLNIALPPPKSGKNIKGTLNLPNWGDLSLGFGNLTLSLETANIRLGQVTVYDVILNPGNNSCRFDGNLDLGKLIKNIGTILKVQTPHLSNGKIGLNTTGVSTIINGEHIKFVEAVLNKKTLSFETPVTDLLMDVLSGVIGGGDSGESILDSVGGIFGNDTLINGILDHWNTTKPSSNSTNGLKALTGLKRRNGHIGGSFLWKMVKLGMKSKRTAARF